MFAAIKILTKRHSFLGIPVWRSAQRPSHQNVWFLDLRGDGSSSRVSIICVSLDSKLSLRGPGARFGKGPKTLRPRKAIEPFV